MGTPVWAFVGNIPGKASDALMRELLSSCGPIDEWKRAPGINGKSSFGHCRFATPDAAMRALRLLNELDLSGKKLNVKVDQNAREKLEEYNASFKTGLSSDGREAADGDMGEVAKKLDIDASVELNRIVKLYEHELKEPSLEHNLDESSSTSAGLPSNSDLTAKPDRSRRQERKAAEQAAKGAKKEENLSDMELEDDKRNLIHREIGKFRDTYQKYEEEKSNSSVPVKLKEEKPRNLTTSRNRPYRHAGLGDRPSSKDRDRLIHSSRRSPYERDARRSPYDREVRRSPYDKEVRRSPYYDREARMSSFERESKPSPYENNRRGPYDRDYKRSPFNSRRQEIYDERHPDDKRFLEVKLQDKELLYQQRLRDWLKRESHKARDLEIRQAHEREKKLLEEQETKRLKEFLEDYDDDRDDIRYYRGSALQKRLADRKREIDEDEDSRRKEQIELELLSVRCAENNVSGNTSNFNRDNHSGDQAQQLNNNSSNSVDNINDDTNSNAFTVNATYNDAAASTTTPLQLNVTATSSSTNSSTSGRSGNRAISSEEKRRQINEIINRIPTTKEELFAYNMDWSLLEDSVMANRIRPWISKKVQDALGEDEVTLTDFICTRLRAKTDGMSILNDVAMVLDDDEAEVFVVKMWRLLIYEVEAKRLGINRSSG